MTKEKEVNIGHDPLAWMAEDTEKENDQEKVGESLKNAEIADESTNQTDSHAKFLEKKENDSGDSTESPISQDSMIDSQIIETTPPTILEKTQEKIFKSETKTDNVIQVSEKNDWITINLPSNMTLPYLDDLQAQLHDFLGQAVIFSAENVQRVDTATLQLLLSFIQENKDVRWNKPSEPLCNAAALLNLSSHLDLPTSDSV